MQGAGLHSRSLFNDYDVLCIQRCLHASLTTPEHLKSDCLITLPTGSRVHEFRKKAGFMVVPNAVDLHVKSLKHLSARNFSNSSPFRSSLSARTCLLQLVILHSELTDRIFLAFNPALCYRCPLFIHAILDIALVYAHQPRFRPSPLRSTD